MKNTKDRKKLVKGLLIGSFLFVILIIISMICFDKHKQNEILKDDEMNVEHFFKAPTIKTAKSEKDNSDIKEDYIAVIEIPKINLTKALANINSKLNNVDRNIQILKESDMPDVKGGNFILASHSGNSNVSHFKKLHKLNNNDIAYIYYNHITYTYRVYKIYRVEKNGKLELEIAKDKTILTLTTCDIKDDSKQLVILLELVNISHGYSNGS